MGIEPTYPAWKAGVLPLNYTRRYSVERAIDGARTRGLDLGKVARYQLRHYRICNYVLSNTSSILTDVPRNVNLILNNFCIYLNNSKNCKSGMKPAPAA